MLRLIVWPRPTLRSSRRTNMRRRLALCGRGAKAADQEAAAQEADDKCPGGEMDGDTRDGGEFFARLVLGSVRVFGVN